MFYILNDYRLEISRAFSEYIHTSDIKANIFLGSSSVFGGFISCCIFNHIHFLFAISLWGWLSRNQRFISRSDEGLSDLLLSVLLNCFSTRFWTAIKPWCTEERSPHNTGCKEINNSCQTLCHSRLAAVFISYRWWWWWWSVTILYQLIKCVFRSVMMCVCLYSSFCCSNIEISLFLCWKIIFVKEAWYSFIQNLTISVWIS